MYCNSWFDGPRRLSYHVKSFHKDALSVKDAVIDNQPQLVECKICGAVLKSSLIKHTLKAHANELDEGTSDIVKGTVLILIYCICCLSDASQDVFAFKNF